MSELRIILEYTENYIKSEETSAGQHCSTKLHTTKDLVGHISKLSFWETEDVPERFPEVHLFSISRAAFG